MAKTAKKQAKKPGAKTPKKTQKKVGIFKRGWQWFSSKRLWQQILLIITAIILLFTAQAYAVAYWYQQKHKNEPLTYGVTFIPDYARYYDLDPKETLVALRDDLGFKRYRLVSYWKNIEKEPGKYDFSELDWQFDEIEKAGGEITLAMGLRQPRWPECHPPGWVNGQTKDQWYPELLNYIAAVTERYKDRPALVSYQLENEYFLGVFGECGPYGAERERLVEEFELMKSIDTNTPIIVSLSNNYLGIPIGDPRPDQFGVSVYKRVFDQTITKRYFEYPFASWHYASRAGWSEIMTGKSSMLHELQAEPWAPTDTKSATIEEQNKSMDAKRLKERIEYGKATGFRDIDLWGGEWWYWRKVKMNDPSLWETVRANIPKENM
jgi:hypothetical protein